MKKHILLGLIAAAFCMDSAKVECMDWYGKVGAGIQEMKDENRLEFGGNSYKDKDSHTRFCGYVALGTDINFSEKGFAKIELGSSLATNAKKDYDVAGVGVHTKANGFVPRCFVAGGYDFGEARVFAGAGAAYVSNKETFRSQEVRNNGFTPMIVAGAGKRINDKLEASLDGSYFFKKDKKVNVEGINAKSERSGWEIVASVSYHISM